MAVRQKPVRHGHWTEPFGRGAPGVRRRHLAAADDPDPAQRRPAAAMDVQLMSARRFRGGCLNVARLALTAILIAAPGTANGYIADVAPDVAVKAAFLYNFAKFTEWPGLPSGAPIVV